MSGLGITAFKQSLFDCLEKEFYLNVFSIDMSSGEGLKPYDLLCKAFPELTKKQFLEKAVDTPDLPDVIVVDNPGNNSISTCQEWLRTIARWAEACLSSGVKHSIILLFQIKDTSKLILPPTNVKLKYKVLAGFPSSLEVRLLCRLGSDDMDAENQWREFILASLAGNDLSLCELLWEEVCNPIEDIIRILLKYAKNNGWEDTTIDTQFINWRPKPAGFNMTLLPSETTFSLLSSGKTLYTPEYGEEIHPSLLAINNKESEIIHRIWRAQAALLLPAVDDVRRRICDYFKYKNRQDWVYIDNKKITFPLEMGTLKKYFESLPDNSWEKRQWGLGVRQTWTIRNDLAHYNPISYQAFFEFWRLSNSVHSLKINNLSINDPVTVHSLKIK